MYIRYNIENNLVVYIGEKKPLNEDDGFYKVIEYDKEIPSYNPSLGEYLVYDNNNNLIVCVNNNEYAKYKIMKRINDLKQNLINTDYQTIKYAEGQISKEEYLPIKEQRQAWRDEINTLEVKL